MRKILLLSVFLASSVAGLVACTTTDEKAASAERNAEAFASEMGISVLGVSCVGYDSEADGYVTCTVNTMQGERIPLECGYDVPVTLMGQNTGCKEKRVITIAGQDGLPN